MIELKNITKIYNPGEVTEISLFRDFSLKIEKGEFVSIVGSNGSGKTSLLNLICGSIPISKGEIHIGHRDVTHLPEYKRYARIGRVYQNPSMGTCGDLTILENMALADNKGRFFGLGRGVSPKKIHEYREQLSVLGLGLENKMDMAVGCLSGGQRQAMALLMTTMTPIDILILDEHTAALDPKTAELIMQITDRIVRSKNLTALMVTHNLRFAVSYGSRLIMMHNGEIVLDKTGEDKKSETVEDLLHLFNTISIECGN